VPAVSGGGAAVLFAVCRRHGSRKRPRPNFSKLLGETFLYGATFFLGLTLGVTLRGQHAARPDGLEAAAAGHAGVGISALGGILGGYILYFWTGGKFNPIVGIAGVSCVPTTAKIVQKVATAANPGAIIMPQALGANISGVITSAIIAATFISLLR
jgi:Na+-transporting methylmalonyl-CoA/oxaloacetate decarboxylase beta subunit